MKHFFVSLFAIGVAGVAAIAATSAYLNSPLNIGPATNAPGNPPGQSAPAPAAEDPSAPPEAGTKPGSGAAIPEATPRGAATPDAAKPAAEGENPDEEDKDPYEGIAPEELPPDLQYDADSSVSFPTNI